jgi:hypothetical protein
MEAQEGAMIPTLVCQAAIAFLMLLMLSAAPGYSQETTGTILGTLVDQTGGVLPAVKVVITNVNTGQVREVVTNKVGQYTASLPVGNYEISFLLPKFQPFTARGISLHVNDRLQVNGKLNVSGVVETLTVTAERLVQPTPAVQYLIQPRAISELPLLTRTAVELVTLVPGVSSDLREEACFCDQADLDISINGARRSAVNWLLDGASNVSGWNNYQQVANPSLEAIQEINVITSTYSAEWAHNGGGVVNVVTKSGTNRFSGSAYYFLRNDALNANSFFRNMDPSPQINSAPRRLRYNNFGYTLGGPALPSRKKLFFFLSQEWRRSSQEKITSWPEPVPDPTWLTDPASPNYVPPEERDPNAVKLLTLWPRPNVPGTNLYSYTGTKDLDTRQEFVRADFDVSTNWSLTGRYLHDRVDSRGPGFFVPAHGYRIGHLAVVEARHEKGRLMHEVSYQLSSRQTCPSVPFPTRGDLGIVIPETFPENLANVIPSVGVEGLRWLGWSQPGRREYLNHTFSSALALQHGTHTLKTGGLIALEHMNSNLWSENTQGSFWFGSGGGFTGYQNFLRGNSGGACGGGCSYSETDIDPINRFRFGRYEAFVQDTWRIHPRVTMDLGLRYAFYRPVTDDENMLFTFSPSAYDPAQAPSFADPEGFTVVLGTGNLFNGIRVAGKNSPYGRAIHPADRNNLQPRIGVAWDPGGTGRLVVRAGYGMYFDQTQVGMFAENVQEGFTDIGTYDPFHTDRSVANPSLSNPTRGTVIKPFDVWPPVTFATSDALVSPRWQHWNIGVQRRLYSHGMVDLGYVGGRGDHLLRYVDIDLPQPANFAVGGGAAAPNTVLPYLGYQGIIMRETTAKSRYHGLVASFHHDAGRAGTAMVNYTLSRNKADATHESYFQAVFKMALDYPQNPLDKNAEFAPALTDRTQIFNASYVYELPFARGETTGWRKALLGGWQIAGITRIESGPAVRIYAAGCNYGGWCFPGFLRPNQVGDPGAGHQTGLLWFNPAAFVPPPAGEYGKAPVAPFRLPGRQQWDFAVAKNLSLGETVRLQLRADLINAFNHTQFLDVNTECVGVGTTCDPRSGFGKITSTRQPREIQLGVRLHW